MSQTERGWADPKAHERAQQRHAQNMSDFRRDWAQFFAAQARRELRQLEAEVQAEEDMLP